MGISGPFGPRAIMADASPMVVLTTSSNCAIISTEYSLLCRRKSALHAVRPVTGPSYRGVILFILNGFLRLYQLWGYFAVSYRSTSKPTFSSTTL
jgi:hypothetical protein